MTAESSASRPPRPDGMNLDSPDAPGKLFTFLKDNFNSGEVKDPKIFIEDALDLKATGAIDDVDILKDKLVFYGQNPVLQEEIRRKYEEAKASGKNDEADQASQLGKLWSLDLATPEGRPERIIRAIDYAEFGSSDEIQQPLKGAASLETDLTQTTVTRNNDRSRAIVYGAMDANGLFHLDPGTLVCVTGSKNGKFIIQGGGIFYADKTGEHISSFKLDFTNQEQLKEFIAWLKESPADGLSSLVQNFLGNNDDENSQKLKDIFSSNRAVNNVVYKDLGEVVTPTPVPTPKPSPEPPAPEHPKPPKSEDHDSVDEMIAGLPINTLRKIVIMREIERKVAADEKRPIEIPQPIALRDKFVEGVVGQDEAVWAFAYLAAKIQSGIRPTRGAPLDVKFLAGPSGVGKTEIVYRMAEILAEFGELKNGEGNQNARGKVLKINAGEYQHRVDISRLLGSSPGYIGFDDPRYPGGTEPVFSQANLDRHKITFRDRSGKEQSVVIVLIDEAEKAQPSLQQALLSVLDKGDMQLGNNTTAHFDNAVIFFTSNVGNMQVETLREDPGLIIEQDTPEPFIETMTEALIKPKARDAITKAFREAFPPEFRGRINDLIIFQPLKKEDLEKIIGMKIRNVEDEFKASAIYISLQVSHGAVAWLTDRGYNPSEGARALNKVVETYIKDPLTMVADQISGTVIEIDMEEYDSEPKFYYIT